jgi:hypothetical protein
MTAPVAAAADLDGCPNRGEFHHRPLRVRLREAPAKPAVAGRPTTGGVVLARGHCDRLRPGLRSAIERRSGAGRLDPDGAA